MLHQHSVYKYIVFHVLGDDRYSQAMLCSVYLELRRNTWSQFSFLVKHIAPSVVLIIRLYTTMTINALSSRTSRKKDSPSFDTYTIVKNTYFFVFYLKYVQIN